MIYITNIRDKNLITKNFDDIWAIVRSNKKIKNCNKLTHVPCLSPSWDLFNLYRNMVNNNDWNYFNFKKFYVPRFIDDISNIYSKNKLNELIELDRNSKSIALCCFCTDESLCHRSIIAGILQYNNIAVSGVNNDYSEYGKLYYGR